MNELLVQETSSYLALGRKRSIPFHNSKPEPQIITSEALTKSINLLSKFEYECKQIKETYFEKTCDFCHRLFLIKENKAFTCRSCGLVLCCNHRINKEHNCLKKPTAVERYIQAKKILSCKLKANKYKKMIDNKPLKILGT